MKKNKFKFHFAIVFFSFFTAHTLFSQEKINWEEDLDYMKGYLEIVHPDLHAYVAEYEFNKHFNFIRDNLKTLDDVEIVTRMVEIFALIQDGHTALDIGHYGHQENEYIASIFHQYPLLLYKFTDGLYVMWADDEYKEIVGKKLLKIGNMEAGEALKQMIQLNIGDNEWGKIDLLPVILEFLQYTGVMDKSTDLLKLVYEDERGNEAYFELANPKTTLDFYYPPKLYGLADSNITAMNDNSPLPLYLSHIDIGDKQEWLGDFYWYEYLAKQEAMYVQINVNIHKDDDPFDAFCKRMFHDLDSLHAKKLIVDVRLNSGGNHIEMPLIKGIIARPQIDTEGNLFLIIGRRTISASEHLTTQMEKYTNAVIFGEPTAARPNMVGSNTWFTLPSSKIKCRTAKEYTQDSEYNDSRITTKPDVYVHLSSEDYKNNLDPVLSKIFMYDSIKNVKDELRIAMHKAYYKNRITGLQDAFYQHKNKCVEMGINLEYFLMDDFGAWVWENKKEEDDYYKFIKFAVEELPNSILANFEYARESHIIDNEEEAKKYYQKCLELNPAHSNAIKYLNLLKFHESLDSNIKNYGL